MIREQFGQPCHRRNKLHTNTDKHAAAKEQQLIQACGKSGCTGTERVKQNAPGENTAATKSVRQVPACQTEHTTGDGWHKEQSSGPTDIHWPARCPVLRRSNLRVQIGNRGFDNQRQHQQFINIERKANGRNNTDEPLHGSQFRGGD
jgi:hypothetical protein